MSRTHFRVNLHSIVLHSIVLHSTLYTLSVLRCNLHAPTSYLKERIMVNADLVDCVNGGYWHCLHFLLAFNVTLSVGVGGIKI